MANRLDCAPDKVDISFGRVSEGEKGKGRGRKGERKGEEGDDRWMMLV